MVKDFPGTDKTNAHMGHVLMTERLVDILIADEGLHKQPRETQLK